MRSLVMDHPSGEASEAVMDHAPRGASPEGTTPQVLMRHAHRGPKEQEERQEDYNRLGTNPTRSSHQGLTPPTSGSPRTAGSDPESKHCVTPSEIVADDGPK